MTNKNIHAYIDASNLRFGVAQSGWELDCQSFRSWLRDKLGVTKAILFMGLVPEYMTLSLLLKRTSVPIIILDDMKDKLKTKKVK